jgi:molybdopterin molybdotransferase
MSLLPVAEAQARLLALAEPLAHETASLAAASNRWAAHDIFARRSQPAADLSAMDGYAIRFAELPGPWNVVGESAAGAGLDHPLAPGEAARIFTGAPLPEGADTVLLQEEAAREGATLRLAGEGPARTGQHVRPAASDFAADSLLVEAGQRLTPARIGLAATGGHGVLPVRRRARIALISTGNELVPPGAHAEGVRLPSSNGPMLAAMLAAWPFDTIDLGIVPDDLDLLTAALAHAASEADIVVTIGGASVGDHDLVRPALEAAGASIDFWKVALKPGKPLMAGRIGGAVALGLPGNPVSAFVTAQLFLLPLASHLMGDADPIPKGDPALLAAPLPPTGKRAEYLRARRTADGVEPLSGQDSAAMAAMASADTLIIRPPDSAATPAGAIVHVLRIA